MSLLFEEDPTRNHGFRARGVEKEEIRELQRRTVSQFKAELKSARDAGKNLIFSAERISISSEQSVARLAEFLRQQKFFPRIVAYVRGPVSYMQSSYQQRLQGNGFSLSNPARLWPNYRQAFEKLDNVFGQENVCLKLFEKDNLVDGDVVVDFYSELGSETDKGNLIRIYESLSLEACSMLFVQRKYGDGFVQGFKGAGRSNKAFVDTLKKIGTNSFCFSRALCEPIIEAFSADIGWMEARLGKAILDLPERDSDHAISNEAQLLEIAIENSGMLKGLVPELPSPAGLPPQERLVLMLEKLRKMHY